MKTIADLLETGSFKVEKTTFDGIECYALFDEENYVVMYEENRGQNEPFSDVKFGLSLVETPLGLSYQISAVMI